MIIDIEQKKISFGDKYRIFIDDEESHYASQKFLRMLGEIRLHPLGYDEASLIIKRNFSWLRAEYTIELYGGTTAYFDTVSWWKNHFACVLEDDEYDILIHRKRLYSVFKNRQQVAYWEKEMISFFAGDRYRIYCDDDADYEMIMAFCLILDNYHKGKKGKGSMKIDFGFTWREARPFDNQWRPNIAPRTNYSG